MQIIIPMTWIWKRFLDVGYIEAKPLIWIEGKPMIEHVVNLFPETSDFIFIINKDHVETTNIVAILNRITKNPKIIITSKEKWPVNEVIKAKDLINDNEPCIINYCDFSMQWDYKHFEETVLKNKCDGAIPSYIWFHPHLLHNHKYASMRTDEKNWMLEIKEKHSFTENTMDCYQSAGTYYFSNWKILKKYCEKMIQDGEMLNGEYYASMVYDFMKKDGLNIYVYEIQKMLQWWTPQDLEEYLYRSNLFRAKIYPQHTYDAIIHEEMQTIIPIWGEGLRFKNAWYKDLKPLIKIGNIPMFVQAINDMPQTKKMVFVSSNRHIKELGMGDHFKKHFPNCEIIAMDPQGPVQDCIQAEDMFDLEKPLNLIACDNGLMRDFPKFIDMYANTKIDAAIRSFRGHPWQVLSPTSRWWIEIAKEDGITAKRISCKIPLSRTPLQDHAIVGAFYFKKAKYFFDAAKEIIEKGINVNGATHNDLVLEIMIQKWYSVRAFEADKYIGRGTPNDFKSYVYRQEYFDQCADHPYKKGLDEDYK